MAGTFYEHPDGVFPTRLGKILCQVSIIEGRVTSKVNGVHIEFDAQTLGDILGVPVDGFDLYVWEDKSLLGKAKLPELAQRLTQQLGLKHPQAVKKGNMMPLHQLMFWFLIKNIITTVKGVLQEEKELNAKSYEDILNLLVGLNAKLSPPAP